MYETYSTLGFKLIKAHFTLRHATQLFDCLKDILNLTHEKLGRFFIIRSLHMFVGTLFLLTWDTVSKIRNLTQDSSFSIIGS